MHVDAFFEYLLGKQHAYFLDIPPPHDPYPAQGRDGVPAEEDLAVRALDPSFRPKRGRRRNESPDDDPLPPKRPLLTTSFTYEGQTLYAQPQSAHPVSAIPLSARPENAGHDPWAAVSGVTQDTFAHRPLAPSSAVSQRLQWQLQGPQQDVSTTPYPMSAIEPRDPRPPLDEPRSAITPSTNKSRSRRKHGPAVSSAWPSSAGSTTHAKVRGRPPVNRTTQDGPFTTFPADPNVERSPSNPRLTPTVALTSAADGRTPLLHPNTLSTDALSRVPGGGGRPERLYVQVPQHTGGPIRLATPTVLVNGESDGDCAEQSRSRDVSPDNHMDKESESGYEQPPRGRSGSRPSETSNLGLAYEALRRILAADLLRADLSGRRQRILSDEAKRLADAILGRLGVPCQDTESKSDDAIRMAAASWLGISSQLGFEAGNPCREKEIVVHRFTTGPDGAPIELTPEQTAANFAEKFDVSWSLGFGGVGGRFAVVGLELEPEKVDPQDPEYRATQMISNVRGGDQEIDWKTKFMSLDLTVRLMKGQLNRLQDRVLDAIL